MRLILIALTGGIQAALGGMSVVAFHEHQTEVAWTLVTALTALTAFHAVLAWAKAKEEETIDG